MTTDTRATVTIHVHDTPPSLWRALSSVFDVEESNGTRWVNITTERAVLTIFAATESEES